MPIMDNNIVLREPKLEESYQATKSATSRKRCTTSNFDDQRAKSCVKKKKSSEKERTRNLQIKKCLEQIREHVPFVEKSLSKIRTLRLASEYINHLKRILNGELVHCEFTGHYRSLILDDFKHVVMQEMQVSNSYKERAEIELKTSPEMQTENQGLDETPPDEQFIQMSSYQISPPIKQLDFPVHFSECTDFNTYHFV